MDLLHNLRQLGLTEPEAKVYLACLQLGSDTVLHIAKYANLKRPTVYLLLDNLERRGLIQRSQSRQRTVYRAEPPQSLLAHVQAQQDVAKLILPSLQAIHNVDPEKPNIKIADQVDSVRTVYNRIFDYMKSHAGEELLIFGSVKDATASFEIEVIDYFYNVMGQSQNRIREIGNDDQETRRYYRSAKRLNPNHDIRLIRHGEVFQSDNMLYGNTLVLFSVTDKIFAITIESKSIAQTFRTLFNMAWRSGKALRSQT